MRITDTEADLAIKNLLDAAVREHVCVKNRKLPDEERAEALARLQRACEVLSESQPQ